MVAEMVSCCFTLCFIYGIYFVTLPVFRRRDMVGKHVRGEGKGEHGGWFLD